MRRAVVLALLALGILLVAASSLRAQTATTSPPASATPLTPLTTSTTAVKTVGGAGNAGSSRLPTLGEGFPWITVGAVILVAGVVGARLRRAARR